MPFGGIARIARDPYNLSRSVVMVCRPASRAAGVRGIAEIALPALPVKHRLPLPRGDAIQSPHAICSHSCPPHRVIRRLPRGIFSSAILAPTICASGGLSAYTEQICMLPHTAKATPAQRQFCKIPSSLGEGRPPIVDFTTLVPPTIVVRATHASGLDVSVAVIYATCHTASRHGAWHLRRWRGAIPPVYHVEATRPGP